MNIETVVVSRRTAEYGTDLSGSSLLMLDQDDITAPGCRDLVIADSGIADAAVLLDTLEPGTELWRVDAHSDVAAMLHGALSGGYGTLHFLGHGKEGAIILGGRQLEAEDFTALSSRDDLKAPSMHFWSCLTGAGAKGRAFVDSLSHAFGSAVTAFSGLVGSVNRGGSWLPDVFSGNGGFTSNPFVNALAYQHTLMASNALQLKSVLTATGIDVQVWLTAGTVVDGVDLAVNYDSLLATYSTATANPALSTWTWAAGTLPGTVTLAGFPTTFLPINSGTDTLLQTISFTVASGSTGFNVNLVGSLLTNDSVSGGVPVVGTLPVINYTIAGATVNMAEDAVSGAITGALASATNTGEPLDAITYSLVNVPTNGSGALFTIDSSTGQISLTAAGHAAIDYESATKTYALTVKASDLVGTTTWEDQRSVTVNLTNVNDNAPVFISGTTGSVNDSAPLTTVIYSAVTTDADAPLLPATTYTLGGPDAGELNIDPATGAVTLQSLANYATKATYNFSVIANDGVHNPAQNVVVSVNNPGNPNNSAPVLTVDNATVNLAENAAAGAISGAAAHATDADNNTITFSLVAPPLDGSGQELFSIDSSTGQVSLTAAGHAAIDFESSTKSYTLRVLASDGMASHDQTAAITVNLTNVNDNAPVFTSGTTGSIDETTIASTVIYTAVTTDADNLAPATYTLGGTDAALLDINTTTGRVTLKDAADHALHASYSFNVVANDGLNNTTQGVVVSVTYVNDNAPVFTSGATGSVNENAATSSVIYTATTTDADGPVPAATYTIGGTDAALLNIDSVTGAVTLKASADFETKATYSFNVVANDGLNTTDPQAVLVTVNNMPPSVTTVVDDTAASVTKDPINFTVTFDEAVVGTVGIGNFTATNGSVTSVSLVDSTHFTVAVTPSSGVANGNVRLSLVGTGLADALGIPVVSADLGAFDSQGVDTLAPIVTTVTDGTIASVTKDPINFTVTFGEAVVGTVGTGNFTATSGSVTSVSQVDSTHYTVAVTPNSGVANGNVRLSLVGTGLADAAGNAVESADLGGKDSQAVDTLAPTLLTSTPADAATGVAVDSNIVLTFSETVEKGAGVIELRSGSTTGTVVESFNATGSTLAVSGTTLTINPISNLANSTHYYLTFGVGSVNDQAGNSYVDSGYDFTTADPFAGGSGSMSTEAVMVRVGIAAGLLWFLL